MEDGTFSVWGLGKWKIAKINLRFKKPMTLTSLPYLDYLENKGTISTTRKKRKGKYILEV
jgi:DNA-binding PadR family transcriptional regulator